MTHTQLIIQEMHDRIPCLNFVLNFLAFFAIGLPHYGRYVSPISRFWRVSLLGSTTDRTYPMNLYVKASPARLGLLSQ
jgi:hypothetical protein